MKITNNLRTELSTFIIFIILLSPTLFFMIYFGYTALIMALTFVGEYMLWKILYKLKIPFQKAYTILSCYAILVTLLVLFLSYIMAHGYSAPAFVSAATEGVNELTIITNIFSGYLILIEWLYLAFLCYLFKKSRYLFISFLGGLVGVMLCEAIFLL